MFGLWTVELPSLRSPLSFIWCWPVCANQINRFADGLANKTKIVQGGRGIVGGV